MECDDSDLQDNVPQHSSYELIDGDTEFGARAEFTCEIGYEIVTGDQFIHCDQNENWAGTFPNCSLVSCGAIEAPEDVHVSGSVYTFGAVVSFSCNVGFELEGSCCISCLANGSWNASIPSCTPINQGNTVSCYQLTMTLYKLSSAF